MNQAELTRTQLERSAAIQPELRAIDAYNPREKLVGWLREHGITTVHTGHAPGECDLGSDNDSPRPSGIRWMKP